QMLGQEGEAYAAFEQVIDYKPAYQMDFSARLNLAHSAWANGRSTSEDIRKELDKMLKDEKNLEYRDRIYYALAQVDLKEKNKPGAIENLRLSLQHSSASGTQKAESYLLLGNLYFEDEDFVHAKLYFDSTLMVLATNDARYLPTKKLADNLTDIALNITVIDLQDSLLAISRLSEEEKKALAFELKKQRDEERRKALLSQTPANDSPVGKGARPGQALVAGNSGGPRAGSEPSNFFAYNDRALKRGIRDFQREWGDRPLEDNWRRSSELLTGDFGEEELEEEIIASTVITDEDIDEILKDVPQTEEDVADAEKKIMDALFNLGQLYRERLNNNRKAVESLEELLRRFPETQYQLDALYYLYLAHTDLGNTAEAQRIYNLLVENYPNTNIVRSLLDPEYVKNSLDRERRLNDYYDETFQAFQEGNYQVAKAKIDKSPELFGATNSLRARFALLNAMCIGNLQGKEAYIEELREVVAKYPETAEEVRAKEIMRLLGVVTATGPGGVVLAESPFQVQFDQPHYLIVVFPEGVNLNDAKAKVSDFNREFHQLDKLRISNIYLGESAEDRLPVIVIRKYDDKDAVMRYYDGVMKNRASFLPANTSFELYPISQDNYRQILKAKSIDGYPEFFDFNYK
ncbi:MAG: tetratricopeptide repeat protein, partial [Saprospiraceae bacterium]|nr:tetratricopeptide repeat protein [Saprospiraceae bacterium]